MLWSNELWCGDGLGHLDILPGLKAEEGVKQTYPACGQHTLNDCFRCTPAVIAAAQALITSHAAPHRIPKALTSLYAAAVPPVHGRVTYWRFPSGTAEARAIATSCRALLQAGVQPGEIMVLLSRVPVLAKPIMDELDAVHVSYVPPRATLFSHSLVGRWVLALVRLVCEPNDYVALRTLLGLRNGVGAKTCNDLATAVTLNNLNFRSVFSNPLPEGVFTGRLLTALTHARTLVATVTQWQPDDTLGARAAAIRVSVHDAFTTAAAQEWDALVHRLPQDIRLEELRNFLWAEDELLQAAVLDGVRERLGQTTPAFREESSRIRLLTMHGAKGLSAQFVFIPGLEESLLPGARRAPYAGLVLEAARLLFVSITRARLACFLSSDFSVRRDK